VQPVSAVNGEWQFGQQEGRRQWNIEIRQQRAENPKSNGSYSPPV